MRARPPTGSTQTASAAAPSATSENVVDEMEARGFVGRHPDPSDRWVKLLRLTEKGQSASEAVMPARSGDGAGVTFAQWPG